VARHAEPFTTAQAFFSKAGSFTVFATWRKLLMIHHPASLSNGAAPEPNTIGCLVFQETRHYRILWRHAWKDLRATFGTRLAEAGCDAFTIAQLLGHSDVRVTMRYVRMVEGSKRVAVEAMKLTFGKVGHVLATWPKQPQLPVAVNG
jgi:hypothetical protein